MSVSSVKQDDMIMTKDVSFSKTLIGPEDELQEEVMLETLSTSACIVQN